MGKRAVSLGCGAHPLPISTAGLGGPFRAQLLGSAAASGLVGTGPGAGDTTSLVGEGLGRRGPSLRGKPVGPGALPRGRAAHPSLCACLFCSQLRLYLTSRVVRLKNDRALKWVRACSHNNCNNRQ